MKHVIHMLPLNGSVPESIELDPGDEHQISRLMVAGYKQCDPPAIVAPAEQKTKQKKESN